MKCRGCKKIIWPWQRLLKPSMNPGFHAYCHWIFACGILSDMVGKVETEFIDKELRDLAKIYGQQPIKEKSDETDQIEEL